jgi:hypothetical protein
MFNDEFDGQGGSYMIDPITGKRVRVPEEGEEDLKVKVPPEETKPAEKGDEAA